MQVAGSRMAPTFLLIYRRPELVKPFQAFLCASQPNWISATLFSAGGERKCWGICSNYRTI